MNVLVTGAAGSIGSEICRQVLPRCDSLVLLDTDESRLYDLLMELDSPKAHVRICDIKDVTTLDRMMQLAKPDLVIHAAAYKHVPLMEAAPVDAVNTNVIGTANVLNATEWYGSDSVRFVLISTDKAVAPVNVMGMTKAIAERVVLNASDRMDAMVVRFGNVLESRGSVIPTWEAQVRRGKPITVTDCDVTRYLMTIPDAASLVLNVATHGETGQIYVLDMGEPVRIVDLAKDLADRTGAEIEITGLRRGEKLHEVLANDCESLEKTSMPKVRRVTCAR